MSVKTTHKDYDAMSERWQRCRDASGGQDAIHAAGERYLPKLSDQSPDEYNAYRGRATFFNATWRTISGLQGMMFRQPPKVVVPDSVKPMLEDVTLSGVPMQIFALSIVEEVMTVGRVGIMVDYPQVDTGSVTLADAKRKNLRPMLKQYTTESIINWKTESVNNATVTSQVRLKELVDVKVDEFTTKSMTQYRVLDLTPLIKPGTNEVRTVYRVRIFIEVEKDGKTVDVQVGEDMFPTMNNDFVDHIPFYFISPDDVTCEVDIPPLLDLVDMNISHYRTTADYEHGCHFTGLPTPVITGYQPEKQGEKFGIGSMCAWVFPRPDAKAFYLEFTGQGLAALEKNLTGKELKMAVLGARMLEAQSSGVESSQTAGIHRSGEQSTLASIAQATSIGICMAVKDFCSFAGVRNTDDVKFDLNRDFFPPIIDALTLTALIAGWQNGAYNYDSLFGLLKQNEIIPLERTIEQEMAGMKLNPPVIPGGTQVNQSGKQPIEQTANPTIRQLQTPSK